MIRGKLGVEDTKATLFVFEGLIATVTHPRWEAFCRRTARWDKALTYWRFDTQVCDYMHDLMSRWNAVVEVLTWREPPFAELLYNRLWELDVPVRDVRSAVYRHASPWLATDPRVSVVYDADPDHRFGYGFKAREFSPFVVET